MTGQLNVLWWAIRAVIAAAATVLPGFTSSADARDWSAPFVISAAGQTEPGLLAPASNVQTGFVFGFAMTLWEQDGSDGPALNQSVRHPRATANPAASVLARPAYYLDLDTRDRPAGGAAAAWVRGGDGPPRLQGSVTGTEGLVRTVDIAEGFPVMPGNAPSVALRTHLIGTAAWQGQALNKIGSLYPAIGMVHFTPAGPLDYARKISEFGENIRSNPVAAGNGSSTTAVAWRGGSSGNDIRVVVTRPDGTIWRSTVSDSRANNREPAVAVGPGGQVLVAWRESAYGRIQVSVAPDGKTFRKPVTVFQPSGRAASAPQVGFDSSGRHTVVWRLDDGSVRLASGMDQTARSVAVAGPGSTESTPALAVSEGGMAAIAWLGPDGGIDATVTTESGRVEPARRISGQSVSDQVPAIGVGAFGQAQAAWAKPDGSVMGAVTSGQISDCRPLRRVVRKGLKGNQRTGFTLRLRTGSAGTLQVLRDRKLKRSVAKANGRKVSGLRLRLTAFGKRQLRRNNKLKVSTRVRFNPAANCEPNTRRFQLNLKRRQARSVGTGGSGSFRARVARRTGIARAA